MYTSPERLRAAMADFIRFYNHERYHEGIGHVTPADVYDGRRAAGGPKEPDPGAPPRRAARIPP